MHVMAGVAGGILAIWWDRTLGSRRKGSRWDGDGLLGNIPGSSKGFFGSRRAGTASSSTTSIGGYGGYGLSSAGSHGYNGFSSGKRD